MMINRTHLVALVTTALVSIFVAPPAFAQAAVKFALPTQELSKSLKDVARATNTNVVFDPAQIRGKQAPPLSGQFDAEGAISRLIAGQALTEKSTGSGTFVISGSAPQGNGGAAAETAASLGEGTAAGAVAQREGAVPSIVVIGTRIRGAPTETAQEVRSYDRSAIENSGQPNLARFLNTLPEVSQVSPQTFATQGAVNTIQLRGFPIGTTLVLIDGRRAPNSGFGAGNAFDISNVPEGLIERVDILPLGSSAIYGSDAIAGVVNFVLRHDLDGAAATLSYGVASPYHDFNVNVGFGRHSERGNFGIGLNYEKQSLLRFRDRSAVASGDFSRFSNLGGRDTRVQFECAPGTVSSTNNLSLPGLISSFAAIPTGITGRPAISDFVPTARSQNLCNTEGNAALIPETEHLSGLVYGEYRLTGHVHAYGQALIGRLTHMVPQSGFPLFNGLVSAANPFNPFGVPVFINERLAQFSLDQADRTNFIDVNAGLRGSLFSSWNWDLSGHLAQDRDSTNVQNVNRAGLTAALSSADPMVALNPFSVTDPGPFASLVRRAKNNFHSRSEVAQLELNGPLFELPGGTAKAAVGAQYERQDFFSQTHAFTTPISTQTANGSRNIKSLFGEIRLPLIASLVGDKEPLLAVSAAVRRDDFSDFGSTTKPQFGIELRPFRTLLLRGSYGTAFRAPTLLSLNQSRSTGFVNVIDPKKGNATVPLVPDTFGGNPHLGPETGNSWSFGAVWTSKAIPHLSVSATFWHITENNRINSLTAQVVVDNEALFPGRVTRDAAGNIVGIDITSINFGTLRANGLDADVGYLVDTDLGTFTPSVSLTITTRFENALLPGQALVDRLSKASLTDVWAPKYKANANLGWTHGAFAATLTGRYLGRYLDYQTPPNNNHLGNYWLLDASASVNVGKLLRQESPVLGQTVFSVSAANILKRGPQFSNFQSGIFGYDPEEFDILGRYVTARLATRW
jgi:iron complex outermembrane recepter protein